LLLCFVAASRPSVVILKKVRQAASLVFLLDASQSMAINDEVGNQTRWDAGRKLLAESLATLKKQAPSLDVKVYRFDSRLRDDNPNDTRPPKGKSTELGTALGDPLKNQGGTRIAAEVVFSDGASNDGPAPLDVAQRLRRQQIPVVTVGLGSEAGAATK